MRVQTDRELSGFFESVDMMGLIAHQTNFLGKALGGPEVYEGADLSDAHKDLKIDNGAFDSVAGHLKAALDAAGVEGADCATIVTLVGSLRNQVVGH